MFRIRKALVWQDGGSISGVSDQREYLSLFAYARGESRRVGLRLERVYFVSCSYTTTTASLNYEPALPISLVRYYALIPHERKREPHGRRGM